MEKVSKQTTLDSAAVETLRAELRGELLDPASSAYDAARVVWNLTLYLATY